jgi:transposase-like protein
MADHKSREQELKARVASERAASKGKRVRHSSWVRKEAVALAAVAGGSREQFAAEMGIGASSLGRWTATASKGAKRSDGPFQKVSVEAPRASAAEEIVLTFASGAKVTGLTIAQLRALVGVDA